MTKSNIKKFSNKKISRSKLTKKYNKIGGMRPRASTGLSASNSELRGIHQDTKEAHKLAELEEKQMQLNRELEEKKTRQIQLDHELREQLEQLNELIEKLRKQKKTIPPAILKQFNNLSQRIRKESTMRQLETKMHTINNIAAQFRKGRSSRK
jgi:hypothetical protein